MLSNNTDVFMHLGATHFVDGNSTLGAIHL